MFRAEASRGCRFGGGAESTSAAVRILIVEELEESRIKHAVAPNNENQFGVVRPDFGDLLRGNWTAGVAAKVDCDLCAMR